MTIGWSLRGLPAASSPFLSALSTGLVGPCSHLKGGLEPSDVTPKGFSGTSLLLKVSQRCQITSKR